MKFVRARRGAAVVAALFLTTAVLTACGSSSDEAGSSSTSGASVTATDPWVKAVDSGMTAAFMTITNGSDSEVVLTGASTPDSPEVQLHEMVMENGEMVMQEKKGGITIPAGGDAVLEPGGDHIMFMDVTSPIEPGDTVPVTLTFSDGSTLQVEALAKTYEGGNEPYVSSSPMPSMDDDMSMSP
jgi:hypothetical protein